MLDQFLLVRPACDFQGVLASEVAISSTQGRLEAANRELMISVPTDAPEFSASATDIDRALRRPELKSVKITKANVIVTNVTGSVHVKRLENRAKPFDKPEVETEEVEDLEDLLDALRDVVGFTEGDVTKPWSRGARFDGRLITATNALSLIQAELAKTTPFSGLTMSRAAILYILQRGGSLTRWGTNDRGFLFEFDDDSWAFASFLAMEMPDNAVQFVQSINDWSGMQPVDDKYRAGASEAIYWAEKSVDFTPTKIIGRMWSSEFTAPLKSEMGDVERASFAPKVLKVVLDRAKELALCRYPSPVPFTTERGSRGIIAPLTDV